MRYIAYIIILAITPCTCPWDASSVLTPIPRDNDQLCNAAKQGDLSRCKMLVENEVHDVNGADSGKWGQRPLAYASAQGNLSVVTYLISKGAAVTSLEAGCAAYPRTGQPLTEAIHNKHNDVARYLLQSGANPNELDRMFPIIEYTCPWDPINMELLLKYHAKIDNVPLLHHAFEKMDKIHEYPNLLRKIECAACLALQFGKDEKTSDPDPSKLIKPPDNDITQEKWENYLYENGFLTLWGMLQSSGISHVLHRIAKGDNLAPPIHPREALKLMLGKKQYDDFHIYIKHIDHSEMSAKHWTNVMTHGAILYNQGTHTEDALHRCVNAVKNKRVQMLYDEGSPEDVQIRKRYLQNMS